MSGPDQSGRTLRTGFRLSIQHGKGLLMHAFPLCAEARAAIDMASRARAGFKRAGR